MCVCVVLAAGQWWAGVRACASVGAGALTRECSHLWEINRMACGRSSGAVNRVNGDPPVRGMHFNGLRFMLGMMMCVWFYFIARQYYGEAVSGDG